MVADEVDLDTFRRYAHMAYPIDFLRMVNIQIRNSRCQTNGVRVEYA